MAAAEARELTTAVRWLVTGAAGQVGSDVVARLGVQRPDDGVSPVDREQLDITDASAVEGFVDALRPHVVVNCAAYTAVDAAETDEAAATAVNGAAPAGLAAACSRVGARLLHLSTDYVFDGSGSEPIPEAAPVAPRSAYGRSKAAGERAVLAAGGEMYVVRTAWVYGRIGGNFVKTIARLARERDHLDVVDDQRGSPTWSGDLAAALVVLGATPAAGAPPGIWHYTNSGDTTWFGFARAIVEGLGLDPAKVAPTTTSAFPRPAARPAYSVLSTRKWQEHGLPSPRPWQEALAAALPEVVA